MNAKIFIRPLGVGLQDWLLRSSGPHYDWQHTLEIYGQRQLSYSTNRLSAMSGIASLVQRATSSEYIAGLWKDTFILDMLWQLNLNAPCRYPNPSNEFDHGRSNPPTWSWASVDGQVAYPNHTLRVLRLLASLKDAKTSLTGPNLALCLTNRCATVASLNSERIRATHYSWEARWATYAMLSYKVLGENNPKIQTLAQSPPDIRFGKSSPKTPR
jgi:hypothetical protein